MTIHKDVFDIFDLAPGVAVLSRFCLIAYLFQPTAHSQTFQQINRGGVIYTRSESPFFDFKAASAMNFVDSSLYPGADFGAKIAAAQVGLTGVVIQVNGPASITTPVTLASGNSLQVNSSVSISGAGVVHLAGGNNVSCSAGGSISVAVVNAFVTAANNVQIANCTVSGTGALLYATGSVGVRVSNNVSNGVSLILAAAGSDYHLTGNSETGGSGNTFEYQTSRVFITDNYFYGVADPVEIFDADADPAHTAAAKFTSNQWVGGVYPGSRALVQQYGSDYVVDGNICINATACYWGSVMNNAKFSNNYAENCSDVCIDAEGSIDTVVTGNTVKGSANGDVTTFFYSDHTTVTGNYLYSQTGNGLVQVHNSSQDPNGNQFLIVRDNTLSCYTVRCVAVGGDAVGNVEVASNSITNGTITFVGTNSVSWAQIRNNQMSYTLSVGSPYWGIAIGTIVYGSIVNIENNILEGFGQPPGSTCISVTASDYNSSATIFIVRNECLAGFTTDILTVNSGGNGGTTVSTLVSDNTMLQIGTVVHQHTGRDKDAYTDSGGIVPFGSSWVPYTLGPATAPTGACPIDGALVQ